jgi:hypothetical protein
MRTPCAAKVKVRAGGVEHSVLLSGKSNARLMGARKHFNSINDSVCPATVRTGTREPQPKAAEQQEHFFFCGKPGGVRHSGGVR